MSTLSKAIKIAVDAHFQQFRLNGTPYILHPMRVMLKMSTDTERIVAILHDTVEDSKGKITLKSLEAEGFSSDILEAITLLTHVKGTDYEKYVKEIAKSELASKIKLADIEDNLQILEFPSLDEDAIRRIRKHTNARKILLTALGRECPK